MITEFAFCMKCLTAVVMLPTTIVGYSCNLYTALTHVHLIADNEFPIGYILRCSSMFFGEYTSTKSFVNLHNVRLPSRNHDSAAAL